MAAAPGAEAELYPPIKSFLEGQGYSVKGEIRGCDLVAVRGDEPPLIVELKRRFTLDLVLQGVDRLAISDSVYLAVPADRGRRGARRTATHRDVRKLCRRLGLGLILVHPGRADARAVEVAVDPVPYRPRPDKRRRALLLGEHARRHGDPTRGGSTRVPIVTAYRQEALRCARFIERHGPMPLAELRRQADAPNAASILQNDVYGWFVRQSRGVYDLSAGGRQGLLAFAEVPAGEG